MAWIRYKIVPLDSTIEIRRGDTLELTAAGLSDLTTRTNVWFTVKADKDDADSSAEIQIDEVTGLLYIAGQAGTAANGSITVTDASAGNLTIALAAVETAKLPNVGRFFYDVQALYAGGTVQTETRGHADILGDVTRAVS